VALAHPSADLTAEDVARLAEHFEPLRAEELVEFAAERFESRMVLTCSWQMGTSILVHMTRQVAPQTRLVEIDTGLLFPETHETRRRLVEHYGLEVETLRPLQSVEQQTAAHGAALWEREPDSCCGLRKVAPLERAIRDADGWLTGIRRDQTVQRARAPKLVLDANRGVVKVQPLVDWSERDCWRYIHRNAVPYNELHDRGFPSIGCMPCTRTVASDEDARAGRWAGSGKSECGLHVA
jgi:phosphoadenosine phosphosulfate reductase